MQGMDITDVQTALVRIQAQAQTATVDFTLHAQQEMVEEAISSDEILQAVATGQILENYPTHQRGACCLLYGRTEQGRHLHLVCTTACSTLIVITVYEPRQPKWITPTQRRAR